MELITPVKDLAACLCKLLGLKIMWKAKEETKYGDDKEVGFPQML